MKELELLINGVKRRVAADDERSLLSVMRDELDLTGTKYGCGEGCCGACTVLLDRKDLPSAGAGESPLIALAPALGNAIFDASGVRLRSLPLVPGGLRPKG